MTLTINPSALGLVAAWPVGVALLLVIFPWPIVRYLLIPLGLPRLAFVVTHFALLTWAGRPRGGALVAAAWAALRSKRDHRELLDMLEGLLANRRLGIAEVTAYGLIAAKRGHLDDARTLIGAADDFARNHPPTLARALAAEWTTAEAAARGDWERVARVARSSDPLARTRITRLLGDVAARLTGVEDVPARRLWLRWAIAPRRLWTRPLVQRALKQAPGSASKVVRAEPVVLPAAGDPLAHAMTLHVALLRRPVEALLSEDLFRLARAWDAAFADPALAGRTAERARELNTTATARPLAQLAEDVQSDLVMLAQTAEIPLIDREPGPTLNAAKKRLRDASLSELELAATALDQRIHQKKKLPAVDEWREWLALRHRAELAFRLGGPKLHRLAFSALHSPVCSLAVWLFNERRERYAAHSIFRWLLQHAEAVDDVDSIRLQQGNVTASSGKL